MLYTSLVLVVTLYTAKNIHVLLNLGCEDVYHQLSLYCYSHIVISLRGFSSIAITLLQYPATRAALQQYLSCSLLEVEVLPPCRAKRERFALIDNLKNYEADGHYVKN